MQCPKCGRIVTDSSDSCLYWGAWVKREASFEAGSESPTLPVFSGKMEENLAEIQVTNEQIDCQKMEGHPLSIKARVEEMLKKVEGESGEIRTSFRNFPESKEKAGRKRKKKRSPSLDALKFLLKEE